VEDFIFEIIGEILSAIIEAVGAYVLAALESNFSFPLLSALLSSLWPLG
jgi:hypothetical protein